MASSEVMTSSTHSFAYSYRLVKKCFVKICETSMCQNLLIFQPIFIRFSLLCLKMFTLSSEIKLNLMWSSSLNIISFKFFRSCKTSENWRHMFSSREVVVISTEVICQMDICISFLKLTNQPDMHWKSWRLSAGHILRKRRMGVFAVCDEMRTRRYSCNLCTLCKVYDGRFNIATLTMFPTGDCPIISSEESLLLTKSSMKNTA